MRIMRIEQEIRSSLEWWNSLPMQNLEDTSQSWAAYCTKYYPDKTHCGNLNENEILYVYQQEHNDK